MKRTILFLAAVIGFVIVAQAQDIITLRNGEDIQALVQEINDNDIKYKKFDNPNGPNYTLKKSEVFMIRYKNGSKDVFSTESTSTPSIAPSSKSEQIPSVNNLKTEWYRIGDKDIEMLNFFKSNNYMKHYNDFKSACNKSNVGNGILGVGAMVILVGALTELSIGYSAFVLYVGGGSMMIAAIPIIATANGAKRRIKDDFEKNYLNNGYSLRPQPTLNFGFTSQGLGVVLKF